MATPPAAPPATAPAAPPALPPASAPAPAPSFLASAGDLVKEFPLGSALSMAASALCAYHGYKRNESVGWALAWGLFGGTFSVIAPVIAVAQGFAEPLKQQQRYAALGTNEFTKNLPPHLRAMCFAATKHDEELAQLVADPSRSSEVLVRKLEDDGFTCRVEHHEVPGGGFYETGTCVRRTSC